MTPARDLVAERGKSAARLQCRACGFTFGRLAADREHPSFAPGLHVVVDVCLQRVEIICPKCGTRRSFTNIVFSAMTIPKIPA
jgi:rubredoxin